MTDTTPKSTPVTTCGNIKKYRYQPLGRDSLRFLRLNADKEDAPLSGSLVLSLNTFVHVEVPLDGSQACLRGIGPYDDRPLSRDGTDDPDEPLETEVADLEHLDISTLDIETRDIDDADIEEVFFTSLIVSPSGEKPTSTLWLADDKTENEAPGTEQKRALPITPRMEKALKMLRRTISADEQDMDIWTEAICVKPRSQRERRHHLRQSKEIFQEAMETHIWVNEGDQYSAVGIPFLKETLGTEAWKNAFRHAEERIQEWRGACQTVGWDFSLGPISQKGFHPAQDAIIHWGNQTLHIHEFQFIMRRFAKNGRLIKETVESIERNLENLRITTEADQVAGDQHSKEV